MNKKKLKPKFLASDIERNWEKEFGEWEEWVKSYLTRVGELTDEIKITRIAMNLWQVVKRLLCQQRETIIKEFIESKRCLNCGEFKMTDRPDLTDFCYKCLDEE